MNKKVVWLPYDFDTALGINNEGSLVFDYSLEDTDHLEGGADVYNGQNSVVWENIRDAFGPELAEMYKNLRSTGALSYAKVEGMFEDHQGKWPEAIFNEDSWFKYILPLTEGTTGQDGKVVKTGAYLPMMQGSKEEQRKWWLYNRFRYIDSKYNAGDALSDLIQVRGYAKADITVRPYADIYPTVKYGSYLVSKRGKRGQATTLENPLSQVNDTEIYIYSASQLASVGDLSGLKVGFADFSMATKLQELKIGDSSEEYSNGNLTSLTLGSNVLLKTIDVRNCPALVQTVDLSGCATIEEVYFDGTNVAGVTLPNGGVLRVLHLPASVANLTVRNQPSLSEFVLPGGGANVTTLWLDSPSAALWTFFYNTAIDTMPNGARLRITGMALDMADTDAIDAFYDKLDRFRGITETGDNVDTAQVSGTIHVPEATGSDMAALMARYPYITINADHSTAVLTYKTWDGSEMLFEDTITDGADGTRTNSTSRDATAQYTFDPNGWSRRMDDTRQADAITHVVEDRTVYAAYTKTLRTYTVTWTDEDGTVLRTDTGIAYGTTPTWGQEMPTKDGNEATGWNPAPAPITGNTTYAAVYADVSEITDTWDTIINKIKDGTYRSRYRIGQYKPLDLGTEGTINMQIVAMDSDVMSDGTGTAPITFVAMELLTTKQDMVTSIDANNSWESSHMREYLASTIMPIIPYSVRYNIRRVNKISRKAALNQTSIDRLWIPSAREVGFSVGNTGVRYTSIYKSADSRIKTLGGTSNQWWLRDRSSGDIDFYYVTVNGGQGTNREMEIYFGVCLGFCLGLEEETIEDDWATILSNPNYATDYQIGDTKKLDLGTEGVQLMEIVAFDADDRADGQGKAGITWVAKTKLNTLHQMNDTNTTEGGWAACSMRSWLRTSIKALIPETVRNAIVDVTKVSSTYENGTFVNDGQTTTDDVWLVSMREAGYRIGETIGAVYKTRDGDTIRLNSMSRTVSDGAKYYKSLGRGTRTQMDATSYEGVCIGFCTN